MDTVVCRLIAAATCTTSFMALHVVYAKDSSPTIHCHRHRCGRGPLTFLNRTIHKLPKERLLRDTDQQWTFKLLETSAIGLTA